MKNIIPFALAVLIFLVSVLIKKHIKLRIIILGIAIIVIFTSSILYNENRYPGLFFYLIGIIYLIKLIKTFKLTKSE